MSVQVVKTKPKRKRKRYSGKRICIALGAAVVVIFFATQTIRLYEKRAYYQQVEQEKNAEKAEQEDRAKELEEYEASTKSEEFYVDTARDKLGLVYENEIVFRQK